MRQETVKLFKKTIECLTDVVELQKEFRSEPLPVNLAEVVQEVLPAPWSQ